MRLLLFQSLVIVLLLTGNSLLHADGKEKELEAEIARLKKENEQLRAELKAIKGADSDEEKVKRAKEAARTLNLACMSYLLISGEPPKNLFDLLSPQDGWKSSIRPDDIDLFVDPWGRLYRYEAGKKDGSPEIYVWSLGPTEDGKSKVGKWPKEKK
jgi:hypothetical protein